ncbi:MAG: pseudouridine synthase [Betaproteobacteria bacterium]|nr:pseudouridine synthase [Betaproteobacteria bacterium]
MRDRPQRTPRLDWPGGIVPEWAKAPASARKRSGKTGPGGKATGKRERLQKVMAQSGYGSRRNVEILIAQGHLAINGQLAKLGDQVGPGDRVKLDGKLIHLRFGEQLPRVLIYHKPEGEICTRDDPEGRPTVFDKLPRLSNSRWVSVGRLDFNTSGLLMFTTNGDLANRLMHPSFEVEREYAVRLVGQLTPEQFGLLTGEGVDIDGDKCHFDRLEDRGGEGTNHWYHVVLREGKNREVRRMFEAVGLMVSRLMRVRYGPVELPAFLKRGMSRDLAEDDVANLMAFAGMGESEAESDEDGEEEFMPGNVVTEGDMPEPEDDFDDEDDRQPAFLMEGYADKDDPIDELDDDRQPDFERLPGFNRATGTMGLPAGHRGVHWASGEKPVGPPGGGAGPGKKGRGKPPRGKKPGGKKPMGQGQGAPMQARSERPPRPPVAGGPSGAPGDPGAQAPGKNKKRRRRGKGGGGQGAPRPAQGQPNAANPPMAQGGPAQPAASGGGANPTPGQGKARRGRRGRGRNRPRGAGEGGAPPAGTPRDPSQGQ